MAIGEYVISKVSAGVTWSQAEQLADAAGGQLASLSTPDENNLILGVLNATSDFWVVSGSGEQFGPWIGLSQAPNSPEPGGGWSWLDGSAFSGFGWQSGQPDNFRNDNVGSFYRNNGSTGWEDHVNDPTTIGYPAIESYVTEFAANRATLTGTSDVDYIIGGAGNNVINGGAGADTMQGMGGNDRYYVDNAGDKVIEASNGGSDTVYASANWALRAGSEVEYIRANAGSTGLTLTGNELVNRIYGGTGADTLNGGGGADYLVGGAGNDTYVIDNTGVHVTESAAAGTDTVLSSISYVLPGNVENLTLTGTAAVNGTGNTEDNVITGNSATNKLSGGDGNDTLIGAVGADRLTGGAGADTFLFLAAADSTVAAGGRDTITDFASDDSLDFRSFGVGTTLTYRPNSGNTAGTLTVTNGAQQSSVTLQGGFSASGFSLGTDGQGGSSITYAVPALQAAHLSAAHG